MLCQKGAEKPECLFLTTPTDHKYESNDEIHRLTVADVLIVDSIGLKDVPQGFLSDAAALRNGEKGM